MYQFRIPGKKDDPLMYITQEAASMLMLYDRSPEEIGKCIEKISSFICYNIDIELSMNFFWQQQKSGF